MLPSNPVVYAVLSVLFVTLFLGGQHGGNYPRMRQSWLLMGCLGLITLAIPNWWAVLGINWFILRMMQQPAERVMKLTALIAQLGALLGATAMALAALTSDALLPVLWGVAMLAVQLAGWALVSQWHGLRNYGVWLGPVYLFEEGAPAYFADYRPPIKAGQGNLNHTEAVAGVLGACALGLTPASPWAWGLVACAVLPIALGRWNRRGYRDGLCANMPYLHRATQGDLYLLALGLLWVWMQDWRVAAGLAWLGLCVLPWLYWREGSGRLQVWRDILTERWWFSGWTVRLAGHGPQTWGRDFKSYADQHRTYNAETGLLHSSVWTTAHNEYVQVLYEYGLVGLILLLGTLWTLLAVSTHPAVFGLGLMLCLVACLQYPWTLYHEITVTSAQPLITGVANPLSLIREGRESCSSQALNVLSGIWLVLALLKG